MRKNIKNEIIEATIKLIEEKGSNPADITIGEICDRVGVGVGLVNYHFQTKDNLIRQCVRRIIEDTIQNTDGKSLVLNEPTHKAKLRALLKINCEYLIKNKNISRISIQTDFINDDLRDNTQQTVEAYLPLVIKSYINDFSDGEIKQRLYMLILTIQSLFLRTSLFKDQTGIDFQNPAQRDELVDELVDLYFGK